MNKLTSGIATAALLVLGFSVAESLAQVKAPASAPASKSPMAAEKFVSDRTMKDMADAEAAQKEQAKKEADPKRWGRGSYTDPSGFVFGYGLSRPAKVEPGVKYPLFIGNTTQALAAASSQAEFPCYTLAIYVPDTLLTPVPGGYKFPPNVNFIIPTGYKGVIDKVLAENPGVDSSRISIEGSSKFASFAWNTAYMYPDTIAAVMPSAFGCQAYRARLVASRGIGIWMFQGMKDPTAKSVPPAKDDPPNAGYQSAPDLFKTLHDAGYQLNYTEYTFGDHHEFGFTDSLTNPQWNDLTRLRKWLSEQKKPTPAWPIIDSPAATSAIVGKPFSYTITASNKPQSFHAYLTRSHEPIDPVTNLPPESLPEGLSLDHKTGVISGTPKEADRFFIRLTAVNDKGAGITTLFLTVKTE